MEDKEFLEHIGILGMKWGKKKPKTAKVSSEDHIKKETLKKKSIHEMSNTELRDLTTRLQLEKQYKDLTKTEMSAGRKYVQDLMVDIGKDLIKTAIKSSIKTPLKSLKPIKRG